MNQREWAHRGRSHVARRTLPHPQPMRIHRLALSGELGHDSAVALEAAIDELCATGVNRLVLDLTGLEAIDRTGVGVIAMRCRLCGRRGVSVELVGTRPNVAAAFRGAGLADLPFREVSLVRT
jgi:anti-anti-sigma factor